MARARNIKPGFCQNEALAELPYEVRLAFALLPMFADREGRLEDRPKRIKMQMFPADNLDMDGVLAKLHEGGFIQRYSVGDCQYIQIVNFKKHQKPHPNEKPSDIPEFSNQGDTRVPPRLEASNTKAEVTPASCLNPSSLNVDSLIPSIEGAAPTIWDAGVAQGLPRSLVGKWIKAHGEQRTAEVIAKLAVKRPADPVQFGTALLQDRPAKLFVPKDDGELVPFAKAHALPEPGKTETYDEYRRRLWPLVKQLNARMSA